MIIRKNIMRRIVILFALFSVPLLEAQAGDDPYARVVEHIEKQCHAKKMNVPFLGVANFILKFWHPAGVKNVKVAIFHDQDLTKSANESFESVLHKAVGTDWSPMVQVYSRKKNESTYIYYSDPGKDMKFLVVNVQKTEAVVAQVKFEPQKLVEFVQNPRLLGVSLAHDLRNGPGAGSTVAIDYHDRSGQDAGLAALAQPVSSGPKYKPSLNRGESGHGEAASGFMSALASIPAPPSPKSEENVIKLETKLVNLNVKTTDASGRSLPGLKKEDFGVFEDGVKQDITFFEPSTAPVNMVLLLDLSGSTHGTVKAMKKSAKTFVRSLPAGDRVAIATFTRRFRVVSEFTADHKLLEQRIDKIKNRHGGTAFYDAMWYALNMLDHVAESRKAVVVLTDGVDNSLTEPEESPSDHQFSAVLDRELEEDATIYPIYFDTESESSKRKEGKEHRAYATARQQLDSMAEQTAGALIEARNEQDLDAAYRQVTAELHALYTMAYAPKIPRNKGGWRKIAVTVNRPDAVARSRRGFYDR
jgi:Ca-activated chloride channel family protein